MNKERRERLQRISGLICEARELLETVRDDEQEAFDNMPENLQGSERGEQMEEWICTMEEAIDSLSDIEDNIDDIVNG